MLEILGVGLPRTGTSSLAEALRILGYNAIHHAPERIDLATVDQAALAAYNDVDAVTDAPAAYFWSELLDHYPRLRLILTIRDPDRWWESIAHHSWKIYGSHDEAHVRYTRHLHGLLFGTPNINRFLWQKRFTEHNIAVMATAPRHQLLTLDMTDGMDWEPLCEFLGAEAPDTPFPWRNRLATPETEP